MTRLYEGMFLIDNDAVRAGWQQAKQRLTDLVSKHGGTVETARRWDERRLAYPIKKKNRATFLLTYFQLPTEAMPTLVRDLEIGDLVLRHLIVSAEAVDDEERKLAAAEDSSDFVVPEPPADDVVEVRSRSGDGDDDDSDSDGDDDDSDRRRSRSSDDDKDSEPALAGGSKDSKED